MNSASMALVESKDKGMRLTIPGKTQLSEWIWLGILWVAIAAIIVPLSWNHVPSILEDQGWFLQVARRVAAGEALYRDVSWMYGPLTVYLVSGLMRIGNYDIVYFSLLGIISCLVVGTVLYKLHRYYLSPVKSLIGVLVILMAGGIYIFFINSYTPSQPIGAMFMFLVLLGIVAILKADHSFLSVAMICLGIFGSLLTKPEYAFGSVALCLLTIAILCVLPPGDAVTPWMRRTISIGFFLGLLFGSVAYMILAWNVGWAALQAGLTGYDQIGSQGSRLLSQIGYVGLSSLFSLGIAILLLIVLGWIVHLIEAVERRLIKYVLVSLAGFLVAMYVLGVTAWRSGWVSDVIAGRIPVADISAFLAKLQSPAPAANYYVIMDLYRVNQIGLLFILSILLLKWGKRIIGRERATPDQMVCLVVVAFGVLIIARQILFGGSPLYLAGMILFSRVISAEFPQIDFSAKPRVDARIVYLFLVLLAFIAGGFTQSYVLSVPTVERSSLHGNVFVPVAVSAFISEAIPYIRNTTAQDEYIGVLGNLPGLYFLSDRRNPFRQDYFSPGIGDTELDGMDFLARLEKFQPVLLLVPQGNNNRGILELSGGTEQTDTAHSWRLFGRVGSQVEQDILNTYYLERIIESQSYRVAVFRRLP